MLKVKYMTFLFHTPSLIDTKANLFLTAGDRQMHSLKFYVVNEN